MMFFLWLMSVILSTTCTVTGVWDQLCIDNCSCCKEEKCGPNKFSWTNECTLGCIDGHRGARCYELCQYTNCKSCGFSDGNKTCKACYDGYYLGSEKDCRSQCPPNCKSCTSSTMCTECKEGFHNANGSTTCPFAYCPGNCECTAGQNDCISCKMGYYNRSTACSIQYPVNCIVCESDDSCNECESGFYNGYEYDNNTHNQLNNCTFPCRNACTECQSYNACLQCIKGKYGSTCQEECSVGCNDKTCSSDNGHCNCTNNFQGDKCMECVNGIHGLLCNETCPEYCKGHTCERTSGNCMEGCFNENITGDICNMCKVGMYGELCGTKCPHNCKNNSCERYNGTCSEGCIENFNGTICDLCITGKYGDNCDQACPGNCAGNLCERILGTCNKCIGHFQGKICDECKSGYYGPNCNESCSKYCANSTCNRETGKCVYGCLNGFSGDTCCVMSAHCLECYNNTECKTCDSGYYQKSCNESCPEGCLGSCDIATGECRNCQNNRFGHLCDMNCSDNCNVEGGFDNRPCSKSDGKCSGCRDGFFGPKCNNRCRELCVDRVCKQDDGVCINGCEGFQKHPECILGAAYNKTPLTTGPTPVSFVGPVVGGIAGILFLLAGVVAIMLFYRRRQRRQDSDHSNVCNKKTSLKTKTDIAGFAGDGHENENSRETEKLEEEVIVIDEQSENDPDGSDYYNYTRVKVANLFSYVTKDHADLFERDFKNLPKPSDLSTLCKVAKRPENISSNRYNGIYPFDNSRVTIPGDPNFFINASYIDEQYEFLHRALVHTLTFGCEALPAEELQSLAFDSEKTFMKIFQTLKQEADIERKEDIATREENIITYVDKCRHLSDIPGNRGRVRLYLHRESGNHDFINAVFINSFRMKNLFIAAQSPLSDTVEDFICMIYQQNVSCVVALEDSQQLSKKHDIGIYLPADNKTYRCGDFTVTSTKFKNKPQYTIKKLTITHTDKGEEKIAYHFQYTKWVNDQKVAESPVDFVQFVKDIETYVRQRETNVPNVLVNCLNGYERSGLFCVVYTLLEKLEAERQVSVVNVIRKIRAQRKLSITSVEQLKFCYQCISAYLESYNTYSNFAV